MHLDNSSRRHVFAIIIQYSNNYMDISEIIHLLLFMKNKAWYEG